MPDKLAYYDGIVIYGNHEAITPEQDKALAEFVAGGKALVALHSASFMFRESPTYIPMVGGQFLRHGTGEFTAEIVQPNHPAMQGVAPFTTWDETYVHNRHNPVDRTVLMERVDAEGREPYTWVRTQGKGRVFYTAFGHDQRTWTNPGFQRLVESGILWAVPEAARAGLPAFGDAGGAVRRGLQRAQLRAAQSGAAVPVAVRRTGRGAVHRGARRVRRARSSPANRTSSSPSRSTSTNAAACG